EVPDPERLRRDPTSRSRTVTGDHGDTGTSLRFPAQHLSAGEVEPCRANEQHDEARRDDEVVDHVGRIDFDWLLGVSNAAIRSNHRPGEKRGLEVVAEHDELA